MDMNIMQIQEGGAGCALCNLLGKIGPEKHTATRGCWWAQTDIKISKIIKDKRDEMKNKYGIDGAQTKLERSDYFNPKGNPKGLFGEKLSSVKKPDDLNKIVGEHDIEKLEKKLEEIIKEYEPETAPENPPEKDKPKKQPKRTSKKKKSVPKPGPEPEDLPLVDTPKKIKTIPLFDMIDNEILELKTENQDDEDNDLKCIYDIYHKYRNKKIINNDSVDDKIFYYLKKKIDDYALNEKQQICFNREDYIPYPYYDNPEFNNIINNKSEFKYNRSEFKSNSNSCVPTDFELGNHQILLKNFINNKTPYKGLLIYHGVGTGKTCSAVSISEDFRDLYLRNNKKIIILRPTEGVEQGWRKNIFDIKKGDNQCTGDTFINILKDKEQITTYNHERNINNRVKRVINNYYEFYGFQKFANKITKDIDEIIKTIPNKINDIMREQLTKKYIKKTFSNRLLIIDEVHNLRDVMPEDKNADKQMKDSLEMLEKIVDYSDNLRIILLSATPMYNSNDEILWLLNILLKNDKRPPLNKDQIEDTEYFKSKIRGYVSYLRGENPETFPIRLYPYEYGDKKCKIPSDGIFEIPVYENELIDFQAKTYTNYLRHKDKTKGIEMTTVSDLKQIQNIVFPGGMYGTEGFNNTFKKNSGKKLSYSYKDTSNLFLRSGELEKYSMKYHNIIENIKNSEGIVFIFSEYIWSGLVPLAFVLEHMGIKNINGDILQYPQKSKDKPLNYDGRTRDELKKDEKFNQANYCIISGTTSISPNIQKNMETLVSSNNINGEKIKIILGSKSAAEGLDFKRIRQIHILEPWYHLNRVEQIVGRGIRYCSHHSLEPEKRNVTVFLHVAKLEEKTMDEKIYDKAKEKAISIGNIEKILKENAIDCFINEKINNISEDKVEGRTMKPSVKSYKEIIDHKVHDKNFTNICSYQVCGYECNKAREPDKEDNSTLNFNLLKEKKMKLIKYIIDLYQTEDKYFYKINEIKDKLNLLIKDQFNDIILNETLKYMVDNKIKLVYNENTGYLINKSDYYIFQPLNQYENISLLVRNKTFTRKNKHISLVDKISVYKKIMDDDKKIKNKFDVDDIILKETADSLINLKNMEDKRRKYSKNLQIDSEPEVEGKQRDIFLEYLIDNLTEINKHKLMRYLIINFNKLEDKYVYIYDYLKENLIFKNGKSYEILKNSIDDKPIGYFLLMNDSINKGGNNFSLDNNFMFFIMHNGAFSQLDKIEIKKIKYSKDFLKSYSLRVNTVCGYNIERRKKGETVSHLKVAKYDKSFKTKKYIPGMYLNEEGKNVTNLTKDINNLNEKLGKKYLIPVLFKKPELVLYYYFILKKENLYLRNDLFLFLFM